MATTQDLKNKYLQMAQNSQAGTDPYLDSQKNNAINQAMTVLGQKYNNPTFNPYQGFYQYGQAKEGYNASLDPELQARYNKAIADYSNYQQASAQANAYNQQRQFSQDQASLMYQQGQKYAPGQLQAAGLGNTGLAETSQVGLMNAYQNVLGQANRDYSNNMGHLYSELAQANRESTQNLDEQLTKIYQNAAQNNNFTDGTIDQTENEIETAVKYGAKKNGLVYDSSSILNAKFGKGTPDQNKHIERISQLMAENKFKNGDTISLNVGTGKRSNSKVYVYYNGKLYETNLKYSDANYGWNRIKKLLDE